MSYADTAVRSEKERRPKLGLSARIIIGLVAGTGCGLFFGEYCGPLKMLADDDGTTEQLRDYWILGRDAKSEPPRWSVIRNVLRWVE